MNTKWKENVKKELLTSNRIFFFPGIISQIPPNVQARQNPANADETDEDDQQNSHTIKEFPPDAGTLVPDRNNDDDGTMIAHTDCGTLVPDSGTMVELSSNLGTMVINSDSEDSTMKKHDTDPDKEKYRPQFLDHFDRKKTEAINKMVADVAMMPSAPPIESEAMGQAEGGFVPAVVQAQYMPGPGHIQIHQQQQSPLYPGLPMQMGLPHLVHHDAVDNNVIMHQQHMSPKQHIDITLNSDFIKFLSFDDLQQRLNNIDVEMEREIEELNRKYTSKRQPILDAMDAKRKRQQNLNNNLIKIWRGKCATIETRLFCMLPRETRLFFQLEITIVWLSSNKVMMNIFPNFEFNKSMTITYNFTSLPIKYLLNESYQWGHVKLMQLSL